jgi:hypothetical protein
VYYRIQSDILPETGKCIDYYKITNENIWRLKYVENMTEWRETRVSMFFPYPIGFE